MKVFKCFMLIISTFLLIIACESKVNQSPSKKASYSEEQANAGTKKIKFPDFGFMLPSKDYKGRVFRLSADFPRKEPKLDDAIKDILAIDFKTDWEKYLLAVRDYVFEGNANTDYENGFFLEDNKVRDWYHVPWQHWGSNGREGYHGLTREGPVGDMTLAQTQHSKTHAYAVGFYNAQGGYTIGKVWNSDVPDYTSLESAGFPEGTVVAKILFVPLQENEVPYLKDPVSWNAYIYENDVPGSPLPDTSTIHTTYKVNLIQMDIMVKDPSAKETGGWVFGNFVYNGNLGNANRWENMMPLGIQWGNDPEDNTVDYNPQPTKTVINTNLKETIINPSKDLPPMHLGFNSRLNGPVDNAYSSCMSCHSTAEYPVISNILPQFNTPKVPIPEKGKPAPAEWMNWFRNVPCGEPFEKEAVSFDYSLQLVKSIQNYLEYSSKAKEGIYYEDYWNDHNEIRRNILQ